MEDYSFELEIINDTIPAKRRHKPFGTTGELLGILFGVIKVMVTFDLGAPGENPQARSSQHGCLLFAPAKGRTFLFNDFSFMSD